MRPRRRRPARPRRTPPRAGISRSRRRRRRRRGGASHPPGPGRTRPWRPASSSERPTSSAPRAPGRGLPGRTPRSLPSASSSNAVPPRRAATWVSGISSAPASWSARRVRPTTAPTSTGRGVPRRGGAPSRPRAVPRSRRPRRTSRTSTAARRGADDVVLVGAVGAERRDELDPRLRRERAAVAGDGVGDRPADVLDDRARRPRARGRRRRAARRAAGRRGVAPCATAAGTGCVRGRAPGSCVRIIRWSARVSGDGSRPHCSSRARRVASYASSASCCRPARDAARASGGGRGAREPGCCAASGAASGITSSVGARARSRPRRGPRAR